MPHSADNLYVLGCCVCQCSIYWCRVSESCRLPRSITIGGTSHRYEVVPPIDQLVACPAIRSLSVFHFCNSEASCHKFYALNSGNWIRFDSIRFDSFRLNLCASCPIDSAHSQHNYVYRMPCVWHWLHPVERAHSSTTFGGSDWPNVGQKSLSSPRIGVPLISLFYGALNCFTSQLLLINWLAAAANCSFLLSAINRRILISIKCDK